MTPLSNIIVVSALTEDLKCGQYAIECTEQCDVLVENATKTKFWFDSKVYHLGSFSRHTLQAQCLTYTDRSRSPTK